MKKLSIIIISIITISIAFFAYNFFTHQKTQETEAALSRNGLVLDLNFGNNNGSATPTVYDTSGFNRNVVAGNAQTCNNNFCDFNGSNDYMAGGATGVFNSANLSIAIKFTPDFATNSNANYHLFDSTNGARNLVAKLNNLAGNSLRVTLANTQITEIPEATYSPYWKVGEENILIIVGNATTDRTDVYLNGNKILNQSTTAWTESNPAGLWIGSDYGPGSYFDGKFHYFKVWNRLLTSNEVANLSADRNTTAQNPSRTGLVGYWTMDSNDVNGTTYYDKSGQNNNATAVASPTIVAGKIGQAVGLVRASSQYLDLGSGFTALNGAKALSFSAWFKPTTLPFAGYEGIIGLSNDTVPTRRQLWIYGASGASTLTINLSTTSVFNDCGISGISGVKANEWAHIAFTWNGSQCIAYVNNVATSPDATVGDTSVNSSGHNYIGSMNSYGTFNGSIDDVRIYNYALSAGEVANLYNSAKANYTQAPTRTGLVGYWNMDSESINGTTVLDSSINNINGVSANTPTIVAGKIVQAMSFNGTSDVVNAGDNGSLDLGTGNFTIGAWINTEEITTDKLGDIVNKFDQTNKKGINLSILENTGNFRNIHFGIDNNQALSTWSQVAPALNAQSQIDSLAVYNGKLYGGTTGNGLLFEWNGVDAWTQVAPALNAQSQIYSLAVYNGKLYGGTASSGQLFEWNGTNAWVQVAPTLNSQPYITSLAVYNGKLYGGTTGNGLLFEWNGVDAWTQVAPQLNLQTYIRSLTVYNGKLYGGTYNGGRLFEWNGTNAWVQVAPTLNSQAVYSLAVYNGKLYGGTYNGGRLFEWNGVDAWTQVAPQLNSQTQITSLAVYNGKLYGGTYPNGLLFEWNGTNAWTQVAPQLNSQYLYSLAVYNGKLYGGTAGGGRLFEWRTGVSASYDYELSSGWQYVSAVKDTSSLKLYINGELVDTSESFDSANYDLSNATDLLIGSGMLDYFNGKIDDVRVYNYAMSAQEVAGLYNATRKIYIK